MNCPYCHQNKEKPTTFSSYGNPYTWFECKTCNVQFRTGIRQQLIDAIVIYIPRENSIMQEVHLAFNEVAILQKAWVNAHPLGSVDIPLELAKKLTPQNAEAKIKTFLVFS